MISNHISEFESHNSHDARLPSLQALRCFEAAARLESFTQAAQALHLTHGAISRAVRLLEEDLGVPLFERRNRRVFLTPEGEELALAVHDGLALMRQAAHALRGRARQAQQLVLSCEPTLLMRWLIPRWPAFEAAHPALKMHLVAGGGAFSFEDGISVAIRRNDFARPAHWHATPLFTERTGPVCRPDKVAEWLTSASSPRLRASAPRLHTRTRPQAWADWERASGAPASPASAPLPVPDGRWFDHFYFSLQAAVAGLGVAMAPWHLVRDDLDSGVLVAPLGFVEDGSQYELLTPSAPLPDSATAALLAWLQAQSAPTSSTSPTTSP